MANPRLLIQLPLLLLGSCVPMAPHNEITIYTGSPPGIAPVVTEVVAKTPRAKKHPLTPHDRELVCEALALTAVTAYKMPPLPNLDGIPDDDKERLADALLQHIQKLRSDINNIQKLMIDNGCLIAKAK